MEKRKNDKEELFKQFDKSIKKSRRPFPKEQSKDVIYFYGQNDLVQAIKCNKLNAASNISMEINKLSGITINKVHFDEKQYEKTFQDIRNEMDFLKEETAPFLKWIDLFLKVTDKLVIGLGGHSVFENDITLHHVYGIPYIPGQAIKGKLRGYIIGKYFNGNEADASKDNFFQLIFGVGAGDESSTQGSVIFLDSYPIDKFTIEPDVMAIHYNKYYTGKELPKPSEPIVNTFLVVKNTTFEINIGISRYVLNEKSNFDNGKEIMGFIRENLLEAAKWEGFGAKTSVGYGHLEINHTAERDNAERKEDREKQLKKEKEDREKQLKREEENRIIEEQRKQREEAERKKFEEETKDMNPIQVELYKLEQIEDKVKKHNGIIEFYHANFTTVDNKDQRHIAKFMKNYLEGENKWKPPKDKKSKKQTKAEKRTLEIMEVLDSE